MSGLSPEHAAKALDLLSEAQLTRQNELNQYSSLKPSVDSDEENDSASPIYDSFYFENGSKTILTMTNFSAKEFDILWGVVSKFAFENWNKGRGRRLSFTKKDIFFMVLTTFKHGGKWDFLGNIFKINGATFERLVLQFVNKIGGDLFHHYVDNNDGRWPMKKVLLQNLGFKKYPFCRYATDVFFQHSFRPSGSMAEGKIYFSGKHKLYGFKTKVSVLPIGLAILSSFHSPGSRADIVIFSLNMEDHKTALEKRSDETMNYIVDSGSLLDEYRDQRGVLMDKGYQGAAEHVRAIHPQKKPPNRILSRSEEQCNIKISSDRVIVENFFGRLTQLWNVLGSKYRWGEKVYDDIFRFCVSLTNVHITWHPLRASDGAHYNKIKNRLSSISEEMNQKRKLAQRKYRMKRQRRMEAKYRTGGSDEDTIDPDTNI